MNSIWIVVADSSRARLFLMASEHDVLVEVNDLIHSSSRLHNADLNSDRPGRSFDNCGAGRHTIDSPEHQEAILFAKEISTYLKEQHNQGVFSRLVLIAPPRFLGHLRKLIDKHLDHAVVIEVDKNMVRHNVEEIRKCLPRHLPN